VRNKIKRYIDRNIDRNKFAGKNVFITGGNSGIGLDLAKEMAYLSANLFLLCRNATKAEKAKNEILKDFPETKITIISLDLASFESIKCAAKEILNNDVDYFINNAGVYHLDKSLTKDGLEITIGTNFIGTLLLNDLLIPCFSKYNHDVHVLLESSITSNMAKIDYNDFFMDKKYKKMAIYARSKLCINNLFYTYVEEYKNNKNVIFSITHPGGVYTPLITKAYKCKPFAFIAGIFMKIAFHHPDKAALSMLYALNKNNVSMSGPRGLWQISGYPKDVKFKKDNEYLKCISFGRSQIISHSIKESK